MDEDKWADIDKLRTLKKYENSFNQLINDALDCGLLMLVKAEFGEVEEENGYDPEELPCEKEEKKELDTYYRNKEDKTMIIIYIYISKVIFPYIF